MVSMYDDALWPRAFPHLFPFGTKKKNQLGAGVMSFDSSREHFCVKSFKIVKTRNYVDFLRKTIAWECGLSDW